MSAVLRERRSLTLDRPANSHETAFRRWGTRPSGASCNRDNQAEQKKYYARQRRSFVITDYFRHRPSARRQQTCRGTSLVTPLLQIPTLPPALRSTSRATCTRWVSRLPRFVRYKRRSHRGFPFSPFLYRHIMSPSPSRTLTPTNELQVSRDRRFWQEPDDRFQTAMSSIAAPGLTVLRSDARRVGDDVVPLMAPLKIPDPPALPRLRGGCARTATGRRGSLGGLCRVAGRGVSVARRRASPSRRPLPLWCPNPPAPAQLAGLRATPAGANTAPQSRVSTQLCGPTRRSNRAVRQIPGRWPFRRRGRPAIIAYKQAQVPPARKSGHD